MSTRSYTNDLIKHVKVETNDPDMNIITFTVQARVLEVFRITPRMVNFGKMLQNETSIREINLENLGKDPIRIMSLEAKPQGLLSVEQTQPFTLDHGQGRKIGLKISSGSSEGFVHGYLNLKTDLDHVPEKIVRVRADVKKRESGQ